MHSTIDNHYLHVQGRTLHYRRRGSGPPVVLLHESPRSSVALLPLMAAAPPGVTLLAIDTPGNGLSESLALAEPDAADYADALASALDGLGIQRAAVYGTHTGAAFGMALAQRHAQRVSGLVLDGIGAFSAAERAQLLDSYLPRFEPAVDGTHLAWLWARVRDQALFFPWNHRGTGARLWRPLPPQEALHVVAMDLLMAGDAYRAPYSAAFEFQPAAVLPTMAVPTWVAAREDDMLLPHLDRLPALPSTVQVQRLSAKGPAWTAQIWRWLSKAAASLPDVPAPRDAALPDERVGDMLLGPAGQRWHVRGASGGLGRPLVVLHPSPGGARGMDRLLARHAGHRPVVAIDLPGHGESDAGPTGLAEMADALACLLRTQGLGDADLVGEGLGDWLACTLAGRPAPLPEAASPAPARFTPSAEGGHLAAAWFHARDEAILGGWWQRQAVARHDFGDRLDVPTIHARAIEALKEAPVAALLREDWCRRSQAAS